MFYRVQTFVLSWKKSNENLKKKLIFSIFFSRLYIVSIENSKWAMKKCYNQVPILTYIHICSKYGVLNKSFNFRENFLVFHEVRADVNFKVYNNIQSKKFNFIISFKKSDFLIFFWQNIFKSK